MTRVALFALAATLALPAVAQTNSQAIDASQHQLKKAHKADKDQAKADKAERKALQSHKVKKAAEKQDKADRSAAKADKPQ